MQESTLHTNATYWKVAEQQREVKTSASDRMSAACLTPANCLTKKGLVAALSVLCCMPSLYAECARHVRQGSLLSCIGTGSILYRSSSLVAVVYMVLSSQSLAMQFDELLQSPEKQAEEFGKCHHEFSMSVQYLQAILGV